MKLSSDSTFNKITSCFAREKGGQIIFEKGAKTNLSLLGISRISTSN
jgi:hypothetical protein